MSGAADVLSRYSQAGFYKTPVTKALVGWSVIGFGALQLPAARGLHKYLVCKIPDSFLKGEFWRLLTSKMFFLDPRDLIISVLLIYYFRVFERRLGSRKFFGRVLSSLLLTTALEVAATAAVDAWARQTARPPELSGVLSVGPLFLVFPWFISFYNCIPPLSSVATPFGNLGLGGLLAFSSKSLTYFAGFNLLIASNANLVTGIAGLISGALIRRNALWIQRWTRVPDSLASLCHRFFGQLIESGPPAQGMMGATLEIQREQQMEAIEQQLFRQQARYAAAGGGGGARGRGARGGGRAQVGQGFAERLVEDDGMMGGGPGAGGLFFNRRQNQAPAPAAPAPSEESIQMLTDMGFARPRVELALARTGNDVQAATMMLLQENDG